MPPLTPDPGSQGPFIPGMEWNENPDPAFPDGGFVKQLASGERVLVSAAEISSGLGAWVPVTNGDPDNPTIIFADGQVVLTFVTF